MFHDIMRFYLFLQLVTSVSMFMTVTYLKKHMLKIVIFISIFVALIAANTFWRQNHMDLSELQFQNRLDQISMNCETLYLEDNLNKEFSSDLLKELNKLCSEIQNTSKVFSDTVKPGFATNSYKYDFAIIILLALFYVIYRQFPSSFLSKIKHNYSDNANLGDKSGTQLNTHIDTQQYINFPDIAYKSLLQLVEEPESNEPFTLFLNEIEKLTNADSSAIFITPKSAHQFNLLGCTECADKIWSESVPFKILPKIFGFDSANEKIKTIEDTEQPKYKFMCIRLHNGSQYYSILVLKLASNIEITDTIISALLEHSNRLSNIVASVHLARLKLRHAHYEERAVIARELHDSLAQSLSYLKIQISRLQSILTDSDIQTHSKFMEIDFTIQDLRSNINIAYRHLRELISTFRLTMDGKNFSRALTDSVEEFSKRSCIAFDVDNRLPPDILSVMEETQLLYIVRESLANIVRHSQAKFSLISIHYDETGQITTVIEDDGIGLVSMSNPEQHFGIIIMQERAHSIGGNISLTERTKGGACLKIVFNASKHIDVISNS